MFQSPSEDFYVRVKLLVSMASPEMTNYAGDGTEIEGPNSKQLIERNIVETIAPKAVKGTATKKTPEKLKTIKESHR